VAADVADPADSAGTAEPALVPRNSLGPQWSAGAGPAISGGARPLPAHSVRRRVAVLAGASALLVAGAAATVAVQHLSASCTAVREYRADSAGAVLDSDGHPVGQTRPGDLIDVRSLAHGRYAFRYYGLVRRTGERGYLDEARLTFVRQRCV
jgi:hypothetical protein